MREKRKRDLSVTIELKYVRVCAVLLTLQVGIFLESPCPVLKIARKIFIMSKRNFTIVEVLRWRGQYNCDFHRR